MKASSMLLQEWETYILRHAKEIGSPGQSAPSSQALEISRLVSSVIDSNPMLKSADDSLGFTQG